MWNINFIFVSQNKNKNRFFYSFTLIVTFIMLNLFIGVILDGFSMESESENSKLTQEQFVDFINNWAGKVW